MKKQRKKFPKKSILLLSASAILLVGSTVGSTRAALTYYSENYVAGVELSSIGVSLLENGETVSSRDYLDNGEWQGEAEGTLLNDFTEKNGKIVPGKKYDEVLSVKNSGNIDSYVRVTVRTSWRDKEGKDVPVTTLDPSLIDIHFLEDNGWVEDADAATAERRVLYLNRVLEAGETADFADSIRIKPEIRNKMTATTEVTDAGTTYTYVYEYDGYSFQVSAEVDAVQTHNAADAVKSAWGVDISKLGL